MYGPCWLNFYGSPREFSELPDEYDDLNLGKVSFSAYSILGEGRISKVTRELLTQSIFSGAQIFDAI